MKCRSQFRPASSYMHTLRHSKNASVLRLLICDAGNFEVSMSQVRRLPGFLTKRRSIALHRYKLAVFFYHAFCVLCHKLDTSPRPYARAKQVSARRKHSPAISHWHTCRKKYKSCTLVVFGLCAVRCLNIARRDSVFVK